MLVQGIVTIALIVYAACMLTEKSPVIAVPYIAAEYMEALSVWVKKSGEWAIIHRCKNCGALNQNRIAADDNPVKLMSVALKPLCEPPFPLERIKELTANADGTDNLHIL